MVKIENLYKSYGKFEVLKGITLEFKQGEITAIVGPNGSGKTTLMKCILGLVQFEKGNIFIDSKDIRHDIKYREKIGYMPQIGKYPENLKVHEVIDLIIQLSNNRNPKNLDDLIKLFNFESNLTKYVKNLSGGSIQKLSAILAFLFDTKLYILDEPTAGLDPIATVDLKNLIGKKRDEGATFVIVSHQLTEVESYADNLVFLLEGKVVIDSPIKDFILSTKKQHLEDAVIDFLKGEN
ncbi:ABC transporter ATP-binding protein [Bacteroidetes/Chlorobi group bacterium Naka2016]|jgi:Cu-processing system ATP-binding protein|nr:MAG: ABC transporter ATP-binding protein [Bacteroidetes/Chlorobi group bacterium Naka2016]